MGVDNTVRVHGWGTWKFVIYNPIDASPPAIEGFLEVSSSHHVVLAITDNNEKRTVASFPSQNVAFVVNQEYVNILP